MPELILYAPLGGWALPLAQVPDPVFAGGMAGDGIAIDPTDSLLVAPCAGEVVLLPNAHHALSLRAAGGVQVLLHVGIDTVTLGGAGFELLVMDGQQVTTGTPLLRFDLTAVARAARSLVTPIIVSCDRGGSIARRHTGLAVNAGDVILAYTWPDVDTTAGAAVAGVSASAEPAQAREFIVPFEHGLHARPAAQLASVLKGRRAQVRASAHGRSADVRSSVALMTLGLQHGERVLCSATGEDAAAALDALATLLAATPAATPAVAPTAAQRGSPVAGQLRGVIASRGLAAGVAVALVEPTIEVEETAADAGAERARLATALTRVRTHIAGAQAQASGAQREILGAHLELIDDPELDRLAGLQLVAGRSAGFAWRSATRDVAAALLSLDDPRLRERAADLRDLENQVLRALRGETPSLQRALPEDAVLIAADVLPSQFVALDATRIAGICMAQGGATSHVAILAAARNIPVLVALGTEVLAIPSGTPLIVDAEDGRLEIAPTQAHLATVRAQLAQQRTDRQRDRSAAEGPALSLDGTRIKVHGNLGSVDEVAGALANGAEGCGLLRTEFLFLDRATPPDEAEQAQQYRAIATALGERPLTVRTLDAGGDKPLAYLGLPHEDNPALGLRGVRTSLWSPALLRTQLRAILQAVPAGQCRILIPMVTDLNDLRAVRAALSLAQRELQLPQTPALGIMIETPASALLADQLCAEADFLSVGTNDLSQYALAMDRTHPQLAAQLDALHPAVLQLIDMASRAAHAHGREIAVCGGLASDPAAVPILIGLGVHELSAVPAQIPRLKREIRRWRGDQCRDLALQALALPDARAVRDLVHAAQQGATP